MLTVMGSNGPSGYNIQRSLRFRASATAYLNRTPGSASNRKTWTWSGWVKRGSIGAYRSIFSAGSGAAQTGFTFESGDTIYIFSENGSGTSLRTSQVFRDPSAWYHIVLAFDTTQATAANRTKFYINGTQVTAFSVSSYVAQNTDSAVNSTVAHYISTYDGSNWPMDGYMAEVNFVDGQALTPSSFGQTDAVTGAWIPKRYTGTYGTNGFYLPFTDTTSATTLAYDASGNGNNWTPNNISTTAGATYDSMTDVPTLTSATAANYCVWNAIDPNKEVYTNGNLSLSGGTTLTRLATGTIASSSGKFYWEYTITNLSGTAFLVGIAGLTATANGGGPNTGNSVFYRNDNGNKYVNGTSSSYGASWTTGDVIGVALDLDANTVVFYKNNTSQGSISITADTYRPSVITNATAQSLAANFGQRPFSYTPPTGFKALNTYNLPTPTIPAGNRYMDASLYTGNSSTQSIANSGSMQPDLVWVKSRSDASSQCWVNSVTGTNAYLFSNQTVSEETATNALTAFNSNGFSLGANNTGTYTSGNMNYNGSTYVAWQWKESAASGYDIVTYSGSGSTTNISHNLGVAPSMIIVKSRSGSTNGWYVCHVGSWGGDGNGLFLNNSAGIYNRVSDLGGTGITAMTSSYFTATTGSGTFLNTSGTTYEAHVWAAISGYSAFGTYTGNGDSDGPMVYLGFRPRYILAKPTDSSNGWFVWDTARDPYNVATHTLSPNAADAEQSAWYNNIDVLANGFKVRSYGYMNGGGVTYIYAAFAENPFKYANAR